LIAKAFKGGKNREIRGGNEVGKTILQLLNISESNKKELHKSSKVLVLNILSLFMKFILLPIATITMAVFFSCKQEEKNKIESEKAIPKKQFIEDTIKEIMFFKKDAIDTSSYKDLPFYNDGMPHTSSQGYVDTFTINKQLFRIIHRTNLFDGMVERKQHGKWYMMLDLETIGNHNDYDISKDLDGDGYRDLIASFKWFSKIYLFDSKKNAFNDSNALIVQEVWELLDTARLIYYEERWGKMLPNDSISSNIFTFKNGNRVDFASYQIIHKTDKDGVENFEKGTLYLKNASKPYEIILPKKKTDVEDIDFKKFWKQRYLKIISTKGKYTNKEYY
jgi:hypothetical protein